MTHPRIYPHMGDDGCPPAESFQPVEHPSIWYVLAIDGGQLLGLFVLSPQTSVCWEIHTCLLPIAWGKRAQEAFRGVVQWTMRQTGCRRIVTVVPGCNRLAMKFAAAVGLQQYGLNPDSFQKHGRLWDQFLFGISGI
jgi:RimJ/RimL family protein N-acetyltransferase